MNYLNYDLPRTLCVLATWHGQKVWFSKPKMAGIEDISSSCFAATKYSCLTWTFLYAVFCVRKWRNRRWLDRRSIGCLLRTLFSRKNRACNSALRRKRQLHNDGTSGSKKYSLKSFVLLIAVKRNWILFVSLHESVIIWGTKRHHLRG